jgi:diacylglycerol kinase
MEKISREYILAIVLVIGSILKAFGIEVENSAIEGIIVGVIAVVMAVIRYRKGDISLGGVKKA